MQKVIVSDTSCLILFHKIGHFDLLHKVFGQIIITETVKSEFRKKIPDRIKVINPSTNLHLGLQSYLDPGEATSISLASEFKDSLLIIDELKGRRIAEDLGIIISGSLGLLVIAKKKGIISSVKPIIEKVSQTNFRISNALIENILQDVNEY